MLNFLIFSKYCNFPRVIPGVAFKTVTSCRRRWAQASLCFVCLFHPLGFSRLKTNSFKLGSCHLLAPSMDRGESVCLRTTVPTSPHPWQGRAGQQCPGVKSLAQGPL